MKYSVSAEQAYYSQKWPTKALPYRHLEKYVSTWLPEAPELLSAKAILDVGAGEATYTRMLAEVFAPQLIVACELFPQRILRAKQDSRAENLKFVAGSCFALPFPNRVFDVVFGSLVLSQLPELSRVVAEVDRVLKPGGYYIGIEPNPRNPLVLYRFFRGRHSKNQFLLNESHLSVFRDHGYRLDVRYFFARFPHIRDRWRSMCMGIIAAKGVS